MITLPRIFPRIGLTLDHETNGGYSKLPWFAIRENYCTSILDAGGIPIPLPALEQAANAYLDSISGLLITGGAFDIPPAMYGDTTQHETVALKHQRTLSEWALTKGALARNMPILGICGGQQLLHVVLGGTLIQHIPDTIPHALAHEQPNPRHEAGHSITITPNSLLHRIAGTLETAVNSAHHQAAKDAGAGVLVNAVAPDGVVEGIEYPAHPFCLGVQWHPEYHVSPVDTRIFTAFIEAATQYQQQTGQS